MSPTEPTDLSPPVGNVPGGAGGDPFASLTGEVARLANELFHQGPLGAPDRAPSAFNVGGGGLSGLAPGHPPTPGPLQQLPVASAPLPKDSDLRTIPAAMSSVTGLEPLVVARTPEGSGATPYFLETAGMHPSSASTTPGLPSGPSAPAGLSWPAADPSAGGFPTPTAPSSATTSPTPPSSPFSPSSPTPPSSPFSPSSPTPPSSPFSPTQPFSPTPPSSPLSSSTPTSSPFWSPFSSPSPTSPSLPPGSPSAVSAGSSPTSVSPSSRAPDFRSLDLELFEVRPALAPKLGPSGSQRGVFDAASIKKDFPILSERVHGRPLVWLDNAATTQKPQAVIDRLAYFYAHENSNVHRAAHALAARATDAYEGAREKVRRFINAPSAQDIVFTRGATEAINLVAKSWGHRNVKAGDEILITWLEHHANIVPWQQLCAEKGARLCVAPVDSTGQVILDEFEKLLGPRTRLVSITQVSNALGTITPAREMVQMAHRHGALVLVDGAQAVSHMPVDVQALDCDFYCFSGHKVFAPTGIGALFGKADVLAAMPPWQGGGNMIRDVTFEKTTYQAPPWKFEAGTGNIADAVGLGAAIDYVSALGLQNISRYEHELLVYATERLLKVPGLKLIGTAAEKAGVLSFILDGVRTEDVGEILDREGIAVRSGHHCALPILRRFGVEATVRASLAPYNTVDDVDALCGALHRLQVGHVAVGR